MTRYHIQFEEDEAGEDTWRIWPNQATFPLIVEPNQPYDPEENKMVMMTIDAGSAAEALSISEPKIKEFLRKQEEDMMADDEE